MSAPNTYDVAVIGGGHNGLICAAYLAKAGRRVVVLEKRHVLGGAAVSEELYPGFTFSVASYVVSLFRPHIIRELSLARHGYHVMPMDCAFQPLPEGPGLARWGDPERTREEVSRYSAKDAETYPEFSRVMTRMGQLAKAVIDHPPPRLGSLHPRDLRAFARLGRTGALLEAPLRRLAVKLFTMSAADFLDQWFESSILKGPLAASGIIGTFKGVRTPGTAYVLLHHYMGEIDGAFRSWGLSKGGTGGVSLACARAAESFGAEIRTSAPVTAVLHHSGRASGIALEDGDEIHAQTVVSNLDPRRTLFGLVGKEHLPTEVAAELSRYKYEGSSGKVNLALDGVPEFTCRPGTGEHLWGDIAIAPNVEYLEAAYREAKYGTFSRRPFINVVIPSLTDPSVAPPGKHVMSCFVQYAPYHLAEGSWEDQREAFGDAVMDTLAEYAPRIKEMTLYRQVLTPLDLEQQFGLTEGNIFHGELGLEQLFFQRPTLGLAHYQTPIRGLWLCGSGTHPGGGIMGASGELAAKAILRQGR